MFDRYEERIRNLLRMFDMKKAVTWMFDMKKAAWMFDMKKAYEICCLHV